jgi:hypothetical protein
MLVSIQSVEYYAIRRIYYIILYILLEITFTLTLEPESIPFLISHPSHIIMIYTFEYFSKTDDVHVFLRSILASLYDEEVAQATRIQYGGSVTPDSVDELMAQPDIDGCLVGGASLVAEKFGRIINYVKN